MWQSPDPPHAPPHPYPERRLQALLGHVSLLPDTEDHLDASGKLRTEHTRLGRERGLSLGAEGVESRAGEAGGRRHGKGGRGVDGDLGMNSGSQDVQSSPV